MVATPACRPRNKQSIQQRRSDSAATTGHVAYLLTHTYCCLVIDDTEVLTSESPVRKHWRRPPRWRRGRLLHVRRQREPATDLGLVASAPFLSFTDVFFDATAPRFIGLSFTAGSEDSTIVDQRLKIPNWPSSDALILFMLQ